MLIDEIVEDLKRDEGLRLRPYKCTAGKLTIGIGRNFEDNPITPNELNTIFTRNGITESDAEMLLKNDLEHTFKQLEELFPDFNTFPPNAQRVLANMHFNLGDAGFRSLRTLIDGVRKKKWKYCADRMKTFKWAAQVGSRATRLIDLMREA